VISVPKRVSERRIGCRRAQNVREVAVYAISPGCGSLGGWTIPTSPRPTGWLGQEGFSSSDRQLGRSAALHHHINAGVTTLLVRQGVSRMGRIPLTSFPVSVTSSRTPLRRLEELTHAWRLAIETFPKPAVAHRRCPNCRMSDVGRFETPYGRGALEPAVSAVERQIAKRITIRHRGYGADMAANSVPGIPAIGLTNNRGITEQIC
jgi:hypothetical protein